MGPLGFRAHAQGPGRDGINLHAADGSLRIRTPFAGAPTDQAALRQLRPIALGGIYDLQIEAIRRASPAVTPQLVAYMQGLKADPAFAAMSMVLLDPLTNRASAFSPTAVSDIPAIDESTTSTFEVGYKGLLANKLLLAADLWMSNHKNFTSPLITGTPLVLLNPQQLVPFLTQRLTPVVGAATAAAIAQNMARLPGGVISSEQANGVGADMIVTYRNFGEVELSGVDVAATALLTDKWQVGVTGSLVSDDYFNLPVGDRGDSTVVALNAPKKKAQPTCRTGIVERGFNAEVRVRYTDEFPANSAGFVGLSCVNSALQGECVKSYSLIDLTAGYRLPIPGASVQLSVDQPAGRRISELHRHAAGAPPGAAAATLRLLSQANGQSGNRAVGKPAARFLDLRRQPASSSRACSRLVALSESPLSIRASSRTRSSPARPVTRVIVEPSCSTFSTKR